MAQEERVVLTNSSPVRARELPIIKELLKESKLPLASWLATLTMHGKIVEALGGLGDRLARHALWLVQNVENEANGINVARTEADRPSTDRAFQVHGLKRIFTEYPRAMDFVVNSLSTVLLQIKDTKPFTADREQLGLELNHLARRHGLQEEVSLPERVTRFYEELNWMLSEDAAEERFTGRSGADLFWGLVTQEKVLAYFSVETTVSTIYAIAQPLGSVVRYSQLIASYHAKADELTNTLSA